MKDLVSIAAVIAAAVVLTVAAWHISDNWREVDTARAHAAAGLR